MADIEQGSKVLLIKDTILIAFGRIDCSWESEWRQRSQEAVTVIQVRSDQ